MRKKVEYVTLLQIDELCRAASGAPRRRANINFHQPADVVQRMLSALQPDSYVQPHKHQHPDKVETFIILRGRVAFFAFDDRGAVVEARRIGPAEGTLAVDVLPGVWHTLVALEPDTVAFEAKQGPYDPSTDKKWAPWAPAENSPRAAEYLRRLKNLV